MTLDEILERRNYADHSNSADHWNGISNRSTRNAYRMRVLSWALRIYTGQGGMPSFRGPGHPNHKLVADVLEIPQLAEPSCTTEIGMELLEQRAKDILGPLSERSESGSHPERVPANWPVAPCPMSNTLRWLAESAGLNSVEHDIFELAIAMRVFQVMNKAADLWGDLNQGDLPYALSAVLNVPLEDAMAACHPHSALMSSGILRMSGHGEESLNGMLFVSRQLAESIAYHQGPVESILSHMAVPLQTPTLTLQNFAHIQRHTALASGWLSGVLHAAEIGEVAGHMLVAGAPGLGKTEWARALLLEANTHAMEMVAVAAKGHALTGEDRLQHLRMILRMLRSTPRGVILFDEADDIFRPPSSRLGGGNADSDAVAMDNHRAALNHLMETSRIPVIWIMNRPEVLDPAVLRRFDVEIHFEGIPRSVRLGLIEARFAHRLNGTNADLFDPSAEENAGNSGEGAAQSGNKEWQSWAQVQTLTPALIDRLGRVSERSANAGVPLDDELCRHWMRQRLPGKATRHLRPELLTHAANQPNFNPAAWSATSVNASVDLVALVEGIRRTGSARLALVGPPGTGKTAFAHALAEMLDRPLLEQRASDLLSAYVGETEQRISTAFNQASDEGAVLFIDEVDGLLANRSNAARNWEVTQVNELLEQLGEFDGVVVIATNRMDAIDQAALRRLDIKIQFEPLRPQQIREAFATLCQRTHLECNEQDLKRAEALIGLTPGDFSCIARRLRFAPIPVAAQGLVDLLAQELEMKDLPRRPMGFITHEKISPNTGDSHDKQ